MKFGLTTEQYNQVFKTIVQPLAKKGAKVYCYGSRARGDYKKFSDLDLMIESESKDGLNIGEIREQMQNSNFPLKLDLVHVSDFAESYKNSYLQDRVLLTAPE